MCRTRLRSSNTGSSPLTKCNCSPIGLACLAVCTLLASGCATGPWRATRLAEKMLDPTVSPRESLRLRQRLLALTPHSEKYLADAFFPIGLYDVPEAALHEIAAAGFNLVVNADTEPGYLARAESAGLRVMPYIRLSRMKDDIEYVRGARSVFAWYLLDEPDLNRVSPDEYHSLARKLRKLDPKRPIFLTVLSPERYSDYVDACDIFSPNPYPIRHVEAERNELREVAAVVEAARQAAGSKPVWAIIQAFWAEPFWPRNPTPQELRAMTFLALNHGADGVIYFSYRSGDRPITQHRELFIEIKRLNGQLRALRGALLAPVLQGEVGLETVSDDKPASSDSKASEDFPPLDVSLRRFRHAVLLIAVNPDPWAKTVGIALPEDAAGMQVSEIFPDKNRDAPQINGQCLTLSWQPHEVRLFWLH